MLLLKDLETEKCKREYFVSITKCENIRSKREVFQSKANKKVKL